MNLLIGIKNTTSQTVPALGTINLGSVYRRYCKKNQCGVKTFDATATSVSLQQQGIYHIHFLHYMYNHFQPIYFPMKRTQTYQS